MPLDFPASPAVDDTYTFNDRTFIYDGTKWILDVASTVVNEPKVLTILDLADTDSFAVTKTNRPMIVQEFDAVIDAGTNGIINITTDVFLDFDNKDYRPAANGALAGSGTDLSGQFTNDITETTRTQWDIGAFAIGNIPNNLRRILNKRFVFLL